MMKVQYQTQIKSDNERSPLLLVPCMLGAILHILYRRQECSSEHSALMHGMVSVASTLPFRNILSSCYLVCVTIIFRILTLPAEIPQKVSHKITILGVIKLQSNCSVRESFFQSTNFLLRKNVIQILNSVFTRHVKCNLCTVTPTKIFL
jgi:hypothetical protein